MFIQWLAMVLVCLSFILCNTNNKNKAGLHENSKKKIEKDIILDDSANKPEKIYTLDDSTEELIRKLNITEAWVYSSADIENSIEINDINIFNTGVFPQLTYLQISNCDKITNLEPLKHLQNLQRLYITIKNKSIDLTPVCYLQNLEKLEISIDNAIIDLSPLGNLKNLKYIDIDSKQEIKNIEAIYKMENLENFTLLYRNEKNIINTKGILSLSKLKELRIISLEIDLTYIGNLPNLKVLQIDSNKIINVDKLNNPNLENLSLTDFWGMKYKSGFKLDELLNLKNLKYLFLCYGEINDVKPLLKLPNLERVDFGDIKVDIMPLLDSKTIKKISVKDEYYDTIPKELFEKKGISLIGDYYGTDK